jgi:hypothetical protein
MKITVYLALMAVALLTPSLRAQVLIADFNADTLTSGTSVTSWTDSSGTGNNATTANNLSNASKSVDPTVGTSALFDGNNYVFFGSGTGLTTKNSLFSGSSSRSIASVFSDASVPSLFVATVAGEGAASVGNEFLIQSRNHYATGSPYLTGYGADISSGLSPVANKLVFSLATYNGTTETIYWAITVNFFRGCFHVALFASFQRTLNSAPVPIAAARLATSAWSPLNCVSVGSFPICALSMAARTTTFLG